MNRTLALLLFPLSLAIPYACSATGGEQNHLDAGAGGTGGSSTTSLSESTSSSTSTVPLDFDAAVSSDAPDDAPPITVDAACASDQQHATTTQLPVDIIWMVDNSASMAPAVDAVNKGLSDFVKTITSKNIDAQVIMLSMRSKTSPVGKLYPICIPQPLAGDDNCGNNPGKFFHSNINLLSTQTLEQFLGTLGQTPGFSQGDQRGGEPWRQVLRANATKTIVVVTDDNARLASTDFETLSANPGDTGYQTGDPDAGTPPTIPNPFNSTRLPPGILDTYWNGLFDGYVFDGIYGWGSTSNSTSTCVYDGGALPPNAGPTYTDLVKRTSGVRAKICDPSTWPAFFDQVSKAVIQTSKLACTIPIPTPTSGTLDPRKVNVAFTEGDVATTYLQSVATPDDCGSRNAWYYDSATTPKNVVLCPSACTNAQKSVGVDKPGGIEVLFGCETVIAPPL